MSSPANVPTEAAGIDADQPWYRDRVLLAIIGTAALLGLIYNLMILVGYGPDEPRHIAYVKLLLNEHTLPYLEPDGVTEHAGAHTFHPPLYYLALLPIYALTRGLPGDWTWHCVRLGSLLICLAGLPLIYQLAMRATCGQRNASRLAVVSVALLPIFGMTASTVNNDSACFLAITTMLWLLAVKYADDRTLKAAVWAGVCLGLGTLCKATALLCGGAAWLLYLWVQDGWTAPRQARNWLRTGIVAALTVAIAGWWHLRSFHLYGTFTPLPPAAPPPLPARDNGLLVVLLHPNFVPLALLANWGIFYSGSTIVLSGYRVFKPAGMFFTLWSQVDWIPVPLRLPLAWLLVALCLAALVGHLRRLTAEAGEPAQTSAARIAIWTSYGAFVLTWVTVLQVALFVHWGWAEGGRYLLPAAAGFGIFMARGWSRLLAPPALRVFCYLYSGLLLGLNAVAIYWLVTYLNPTFGPHH